jgi:hypothetical protein
MMHCNWLLCKGASLKKTQIVTILLVLLSAGCGQGDRGNPEKSGKAGTRSIRVQVISTRGCANTPKAMNLIRAAAKEIGARIELEQKIISTQEEAKTLKFHGSPTVLINGLDLDPNMRDNTAYGFT